MRFILLTILLFICNITDITIPIGATDSLINAMIEGLDQTWRKSGASFGGADMKIQYASYMELPCWVAGRPEEYSVIFTKG